MKQHIGYGTYICARVEKQEAINRIQKSCLWGKKKGGGMAWGECFSDINTITFLMLKGGL